jgi:hypothetical protein
LVLTAARALVIGTLPAASAQPLPPDEHLPSDRVGEIEPL